MVISSQQQQQQKSSMTKNVRGWKSDVAGLMGICTSYMVNNFAECTDYFLVYIIMLTFKYNTDFP